MFGRPGSTSRFLVLVLASLAALSGAFGAAAGRRPPPSVTFCSTHFEGRFAGPPPSSSVTLCPGNSETLVSVVGMVPATCRDAKGATYGPTLGVAVHFNVLPRTPIGPGGSFSFTARSPGGRVLGDVPKATLHVQGVFAGTTVKGRVRIDAGAWFRYTRCVGEARFSARIVRG